MVACFFIEEIKHPRNTGGKQVETLNFAMYIGKSLFFVFFVVLFTCFFYELVCQVFSFKGVEIWSKGKEHVCFAFALLLFFKETCLHFCVDACVADRGDCLAMFSLGIHVGLEVDHWRFGGGFSYGGLRLFNSGYSKTLDKEATVSDHLHEKRLYIYNQCMYYNNYLTPSLEPQNASNCHLKPP